MILGAVEFISSHGRNSDSGSFLAELAESLFDTKDSAILKSRRVRVEHRYAPSEASRAFPGWRAAEIHGALNERVISEETSEILSRVGRALGEREGTGPDDDPLLREQRAEGRAQGAGRMTRAVLRQRGVAVPADFPADFPAGCHLSALRSTPEDRLLSAASAAVNFADFLSRLDSPEP